MNSFVSVRFSTKSKKFGISILLACLSGALLCLFRNSYVIESTRATHGALWGILFFLLFAAVGSVKVTAHKPIAHYILNGCWSFAFAFAMLLWTLTALDAVAIWRTPILSLCLNTAFIFALVFLLYSVIGRWKPAVSIVGIITFLVGIANSYVWQFRGREILFSDLYALGTALEVVSEYTPVISFRMIFGFSIWCLVFFSQFSFTSDFEQKAVRRRWASVVSAVVLLAVMVAGSWNGRTYSYDTLGSTRNGFYVNYLLSIRDGIVTAPEGYSEQAVQEIEYDYRADSSQTTEKPNIIVIMNESYADLRVLGENFHTNQPVMPFFDSLEQNTIRGYAYASVYGGSTANSEFEFLTGLTMGFLPIGSTPYQQYIREDTYSLAWVMQSYGYRCFATHPYLEKGWNRLRVYPQLGFSSSTFIQDYPQENLQRNWVSDREMYEYIIEHLQENDSDQPAFVFGITMQNHGGYEYEGENYTQTISLEGYNKEYPWAEQYLSLINESDKALSYLISELEKSSEKTIVVFFGDHFPQVENELYEEIHGGPFVTLAEQMLRYKVPFVIWANYDIPEQFVPFTSLNYLPLYLFEAANMELPAFYRFLSDAKETLPALTAQGFYSLDAQKFLPYHEASGAEAEWLRKYAIVQYNSLFDTKARSKLFFSRYLSAD